MPHQIIKNYSNFSGIHLVYSFYRSIQLLDTFRRKVTQPKAYKHKTQTIDFSMSCVITVSLLLNYVFYVKYTGGGGRIRTHEALASLTVFKTAAFNRSATPPTFPYLVYTISLDIDVVNVLQK